MSIHFSKHFKAEWFTDRLDLVPFFLSNDSTFEDKNLNMGSLEKKSLKMEICLR